MAFRKLDEIARNSLRPVITSKDRIRNGQVWGYLVNICGYDPKAIREYVVKSRKKKGIN